MDTFNITMSGVFIGIAALFTLGLTPRWASAFYPRSPSLGRRLAAPALFLLLAAACFAGFAIQAFVVTIIAGLPLIIINRRNERRDKPEGTV